MEGDDAEAGGPGQKQQGGARPLQTFVFSATLTLPPALRKRLRKGGCGWADPGRKNKKDPVAVCGGKSALCGLFGVTITPACWGVSWGPECWAHLKFLPTTHRRWRRRRRQQQPGWPHGEDPARRAPQGQQTAAQSRHTV